MLKTQNISYSIGTKQILKNINTAFLPGEFNMILGPNGSGKSSFLKIFSGEINEYGGDVLYEQTNLRSVHKETLAKRRAVMSQQPELDFPLMVEEVVMMGRYPHFHFNPGKKDEQICEEVMTALNLHPFKERNYLTLSGGEKQRVQFARVLAQIWTSTTDQPRYLFLDEPLTSLDINYQQEFLQLARNMVKENIILVAVMHDINLAIQFADKLLFLKQGEIAAQGAPSAILSEELLWQVFGVHTHIISHPISGSPLVIYR